LKNHNDQEDIVLKVLKIKHDGDVDEEYFQDMYITAQGETVASDYTVDGKYFTFVFDQGGFVL